VLLVQADEVNVLVADNGAAPLLHANVIVAVVLCEAPDYVKWSGRNAVGTREIVVPTAHNQSDARNVSRLSLG
jgi:hypothetical protein